MSITNYTKYRKVPNLKKFLIQYKEYTVILNSPLF